MKKIIAASVVSLLLAGCTAQPSSKSNAIHVDKTDKANTNVKEADGIKYPRCTIMMLNEKTGRKFSVIGTDAWVIDMGVIFQGFFTTPNGGEINVMSSIIEPESRLNQPGKVAEGYYGSDEAKGINYSRTLDLEDNTYSFIASNYKNKPKEDVIGFVCPKNSAVPFYIHGSTN